MPFIAAAVMGVFVYGGYKLFMMLCNMNAISTLLSIIFGAVVYAIVLIKIGGLSEDVILEFPKGTAIVRLLKKVRLL